MKSKGFFFFLWKTYSSFNNTLGFCFGFFIAMTYDVQTSHALAEVMCLPYFSFENNSDANILYCHTGQLEKL